MLFGEKIILFHQDIVEQEEAFKRLADEFFKKDCVSEDFLPNIIQREIDFPTGLLTHGIGVAIPHTDHIYVKKSQIGFLSLKKPIRFMHMGTNDQEVAVSLIFMLALKEPHEQLEMLQNLVALFQREGVLEKLEKVTCKDTFLQVMKEQGIE